MYVILLHVNGRNSRLIVNICTSMTSSCLSNTYYVSHPKDSRKSVEGWWGYCNPLLVLRPKGRVGDPLE